jgi:hypothetical protein
MRWGWYVHLPGRRNSQLASHVLVGRMALAGRRSSRPDTEGAPPSVERQGAGRTLITMKELRDVDRVAAEHGDRRSAA